MDTTASSTFYTVDEPKLLPSFTKRRSAASPKAKKAPQAISRPSFVSETLSFDSDSHKSAHKAVLKHQQTATRKAPPGLKQVVHKEPKPRKLSKPSTNKVVAKRLSCNECLQKKIKCDATSESWKGGRCHPCKAAGIHCSSEGESGTLLESSTAQIIDENFLDNEDLQEVEDEAQFQSPVRTLKLIDTHPVDRSKGQRNATKELESLSTPANCLRLQKAQDEIERMEADRRVKEPARMKQRALIQTLQAEISANDRSSETFYRPEECQNERKRVFKSPDILRATSSTSSMSLAFQNYEANLKIVFEMAKAQDTAENISMQTQIVAMLREKAMGKISSDMFMEDAYGENVRTDTGFIRLQELDSQAIDIEDDGELDLNGPIVKTRRQNRSRDEEASIALPASRPTQMPRDVRTQKKLGVGEIASNVKTHATFEMFSTKHMRKINTTNKSTINQKRLPPKRDNTTRIRGNLSAPPRP